MASSQQIAEALKAQREKRNSAGNPKERKSRSQGDKALYPFWDAPMGGEPVVLRYLPDADPDNLFFWQNREVIKLPFNGISGGEYATSKPVEVTVPCINMFGKRCPIIDYCRPWWPDKRKSENDPSQPTKAQQKLAKLYWKKKTWILQGFVVKSPIQEEEVPENLIRKFTVGAQIFKLIEDSLISGEMPEPPTHFDGGRDFTVKKSDQGGHNNYGTSGWSLAGPRSLTERERDAVSDHGLFDLKLSKGEIPDAERMAIIEALFHSSLAGDPFDVTAFGDSGFRAFAADSRDNAASDAVIAAVAARPSVHAVSLPAAEPTAPETASTDTPRKLTAQELLASMRAKMSAQ